MLIDELAVQVIWEYEVGCEFEGEVGEVVEEAEVDVVGLVVQGFTDSSGGEGGGGHLKAAEGFYFAED